MKTLSVVVPCYNEEKTLPTIVECLCDIASEELRLEIIIVDDCSTDDSARVAQDIANERNGSKSFVSIKVCQHEINRGKGAALRTGFLSVSGDFVVVQDADMEYEPRDFLRMIIPLKEDRADIAFGSRYLPQTERNVLCWWHSKLNSFLTICSNCLSDLYLTDMETCYKMFRSDIIREIAPTLQEERFGFEPEIVARIAKGKNENGWRIVECPIAYHPRAFDEGKKIGWVDGVRALYCIVKYNLFCR